MVVSGIFHVARNPCGGSGVLSLRNGPFEDGLLHVQPVFRLVENRLGIRLERLFLNLLAAIGRQAMHHERAGLGQLNQRPIDLIAGQQPDSFRSFSLFAHRDPDVSVEQIGS